MSIANLLRLIRAHDGPLTRELVQSPASFGLGRLPGTAIPSGTADMVCGFCSTGCSLTVHLDKDRQAMGLSSTTRYPVNLGMACPKGWEALSVLDSPNRATIPPLRDAKGRFEPIDWGTAVETFARHSLAVVARATETHGTCVIGLALDLLRRCGALKCVLFRNLSRRTGQ